MNKRESAIEVLVDAAFTEWTSMTHLDTHTLVRDELILRAESGHDVEHLAAMFLSTGPDDESTLLDLYEQVQGTTPDSSWPYDEPSDLDAILGTLPLDPNTSSGEVSDDQILGAWLGRITGCTLGKPVEDRSWTAHRLREYLELAGAYPLANYIPAMDPMPRGFRFRECWTETTLGRIRGAARDDDIDYTILGLHLLERHGARLTTDHVAAAWLELLPYHQVFTAERAAYANLLAGVHVLEAGVVRNPYREWIGASIRGDIFGWANPGAPRRAALLAYRDAVLSHRGNGIYGEMWVAALTALIPICDTIEIAVAKSLEHIPPRSRVAETIRDVLDAYRSKAAWEDALHHIQRTYGHYFIVHTINNAALVVAGLLWGEHDFARTVGLTVQGAWDTDSNGATAGGVCGLFVGAEALPGHFVEPLEDKVRSALAGHDNLRITHLADRTTALVTALSRAV